MKEDKKYIFITGKSESGKSMISEYISKKYKGAIHIKMRDIIKEMYKEYNTKLSYEEWQEELENNQREFFWKTYINMANKIAKEHNLIVMDTLRKKETLEVINKLAGNNIMLLYIDAEFEYRVNREYNRLNKEDNISYEQIKINTLKKDKEKEQYGLIQILNYLKADKMKHGYIIYNNGTIEDFKKNIDNKIKMFLGD